LDEWQISFVKVCMAVVQIIQQNVVIRKLDITVAGYKSPIPPVYVTINGMLLFLSKDFNLLMATLFTVLSTSSLCAEPLLGPINETEPRWDLGGQENNSPISTENEAEKGGSDSEIPVFASGICNPRLILPDPLANFHVLHVHCHASILIVLMFVYQTQAFTADNNFRFDPSLFIRSPSPPPLSFSLFSPSPLFLPLLSLWALYLTLRLFIFLPCLFFSLYLW
jgi:hypothetical protein